MALDIMANVCWSEKMDRVILERDMLDIFSLRLSSYGEIPKVSVLWGLENAVG